MRIIILAVLLAALSATPARAMPRPGDIDWTCGRVTDASLGGSFAAFSLEDRGGGTHDFVVPADSAAFSSIANLVLSAAETSNYAVVGHERGAREARMVAVGDYDALCWKVESAAREAYQGAYERNASAPKRRAHR